MLSLQWVHLLYSRPVALTTFLYIQYIKRMYLLLHRERQQKRCESWEGGRGFGSNESTKESVGHFHLYSFYNYIHLSPTKSRLHIIRAQRKCVDGRKENVLLSLIQKYIKFILQKFVSGHKIPGNLGFQSLFILFILCLRVQLLP